MRAKLMLGTMALAAFALAAQDSVKFERRYREGDKDVYTISMQMTIGPGNVDVNLKSTQVVKKVYETGEADVESTVSDLKASFNGENLSPPAGPATTTKYDKNGMPVEVKSARGKGGMNMSFLRYANLFGDKPLKVGETVPIDYTDPKNPKASVKGNVKLESIEAGVAKIISNLDITNADTGDKPMRASFTVWMDVATSKPNKTVGTISNVVGPQGMQIDGIQLTMERAKQ